MKIYEQDTHEAKYLYVENGEQYNELEGRLIGNIDNHYILRPIGPVSEDGVFRFDVTSCDSFASYLINRKLSKAELISVLAQMKSVITTLEDHMLGDANILLKPEQMYIDKNSRKVRFVPVCRQDGGFPERLRGLTEALFIHTDMEDTDSLRFAAMMMKLSLKESVRLHDLMQLVDTRRISLPERKPEARQTLIEEPENSGREVERLHGSSVIADYPREDLTMRISEEERKRCFPEDDLSDDVHTIKEEPTGLKGFFHDIARGFRDRMDDD